jgi:hypothetical protein
MDLSKIMLPSGLEHQRAAVNTVTNEFSDSTKRGI